MLVDASVARSFGVIGWTRYFLQVGGGTIFVADGVHGQRPGDPSELRNIRIALQRKADLANPGSGLASRALAAMHGLDKLFSLAPNKLTVLTLSKDELDIAVRLQSRRPEDREWRRSLGARSRRLDAGESASIAIALSRSHAFASDDEDAHPVEGTHRHSWAPDQRLVRAARCRRSHRQEEARQTCHVLQTDDLHNLGGPPW